MTEKRYLLKWLEYEPYYIDTKQEYVDEAELRFELDGYKTMSDEQVVTLLNENEQLKNMCENLVNSDNRREYKLKQKIRELEKENERLKNELYCFKSSNDILQKELIKKVEEKAKLKTQNQGLQFKIIDMLDFVKDKGSVTREEIKEWWNNSQRRDDKL